VLCSKDFVGVDDDSPWAVESEYFLCAFLIGLRDNFPNGAEVVAYATPGEVDVALFAAVAHVDVVEAIDVVSHNEVWVVLDDELVEFLQKLCFCVARVDDDVVNVWCFLETEDVARCVGGDSDGDDGINVGGGKDAWSEIAFDIVGQSFELRLEPGGGGDVVDAYF